MDTDCDEKKQIFNEGVLFFDKFGEELWEICPIDSTHYGKKKWLSSHIQDCKERSLKGPRKVECPFNPLHIINLMEITEHVMTCQNRTVQTNGLCDFEPKRETIEGVKMEPMNIALQVPNTWGDDQNPTKSYDPEEAIKFRTVLKPPPPGLSKKQKKEYRERERQRWKSLTGETKEKPRSVPYPTPNQIKNARIASKEVAAMKTEDDIIGIIDKLGSANIADPRDSMMKRINARLKVLQVMEAKLKEEKMELQRQVEQYLATIGNTEESSTSRMLMGSLCENMQSRNADPRMAPRKNTNETRYQSMSSDCIPMTSRIVPDMMTSIVS